MRRDEVLWAMTSQNPLAAEVRQGEKKANHPIAIQDPEEQAQLIAGHLAGQLPPVLCRAADGREWTQTEGRALAAGPLRLGDGQATWLAWDIDAAGMGHATAQTADEADVIAADVRLVLRDADLPGLTVSTGGGVGRHVIVLLDHPQPAAFAVWLADLVREVVAKRHPGADIETRPNTVNGSGGMIALPFRGSCRSPLGGRLLAPATVDEVQPARDAAMDPLRLRWERCVVARQQLADQRKRDRERLLAAAKAKGADDVQSAAIDLRAVVESLGEITREAGGEIILHCPHHGGSSALRVNPGKRVWRCFQCEQGGAGDASAFTLAKWLMGGDPSAREVFEALRGVSHV